MSTPTPYVRTLTLLAFVLACLGFTGYLFVKAGGSLLGLGRAGDYTVAFDTEDLGNLVPYADVQTAGVTVGKVATVTRLPDNLLRLELQLDEVVTPLHDGATVQVGEKSLAGQPMIQLVDGAGQAIADGAVLPPSSVIPPVRLRDVLAGLDEPTRAALGSLIRSTSRSIDGRAPDIAAMMTGLTDLGRHGATALDALAAQSSDLRQLARELDQTFDALDTGQGQIADLVSSANELSAATAGQRPALEASTRQLPGVLDSATEASTAISTLSRELTPIANDVARATPELNDALDRLPEAGAELRGLLPPLSSVLDRAPDTLRRVPETGDRARELFPPATDVLRDLNPTLRYLKPYGADISQFITNFGAAIHHHGEDGGSYLYFRPIFSPQTVHPSPITLPGSLFQSNPYPAPGGLRNLTPFIGPYPRVVRDN